MRTKNLRDAERDEIAMLLLENSTDGVPGYGSMSILAGKFDVSRRSISKIWKTAKEQRRLGVKLNVASKKKGNCGRHKMPFDEEAVMAVDLSKRTTMKRLSMALGVSESTVQRWVRNGLIRSHNNRLKPDLRPQNKLHRLRFCCSKLFYDSLFNLVLFKSMKHVIHIDEKWFYLTTDGQKYYLTPAESDPYRSCKSKNFIPKVMFLCAVARPIIDADGEVLFDGKIGIWPLTYQVPAQRNSRNRPAGTMVTKPIESITKAVIKDFLINKIIPSIKEKWPQEASKNISIQQDNAKTHISPDDQDFVAAATSENWNIQLEFQPPNSPDMNVLDLGFFRAIQSLQVENAAYSIDELVSAVQKAYQDLHPNTLNNVFISWQACMLEVMKIKGHNNYKLPHMKKATLQRQGLLPDNLTADEALVRECIDHLVANGQIEDIDQIMEDLGYNEHDITTNSNEETV